MLSSNILTRAALYATVAAVGWASNPNGDYVLNIILFIIVSMLLEMFAYKDGVVNGMYIYKNLKPQDKKNIDKILEDIEDV